MIARHLVALLPIFLLLSNGCGDSCGEIACLPAPPALEVLVVDTISVDTTIRRLERIDSIDVDTVVVRNAAISDATVLMVVDSSGVISSVGELRRFDSLYQEADIARIPGGEFKLRALRGARGTTSNPIAIQYVEGCCPYSIVGRYILTLPKDTTTI